MFEKPPFTEAEEQKILEAIKSAESNTSGEIRLHIEKHCKIDPYDRAIEVFEKLGMTKTEQRNGVLVYMALADHKFAILGDEVIVVAIRAADGFEERAKERVVNWLDERRPMLQEYDPANRHTIPLTGDLVE